MYDNPEASPRITVSVTLPYSVIVLADKLAAKGSARPVLAAVNINMHDHRAEVADGFEMHTIPFAASDVTGIPNDLADHRISFRVDRNDLAEFSRMIKTNTPFTVSIDVTDGAPTNGTLSGTTKSGKTVALVFQTVAGTYPNLGAILKPVDDALAHIGFDPAYLKAFAEMAIAQGAYIIRLHPYGPTKPCVITVHGHEGDELLGIGMLMPMVTDAEDAEMRRQQRGADATQVATG